MQGGQRKMNTKPHKEQRPGLPSLHAEIKRMALQGWPGREAQPAAAGLKSRVSTSEGTLREAK